MRPVKRLLLLTWVLGVASLGGACGDDGTTAPPPPAVDRDGIHTQFVIDRILLPTTATQASMLGLNIDGDEQGRPDNALGQILATLSSQGGEAVDLQGEIDLAMNQGNIIVLANMQAKSLQTATGVGMWVFLGADPDPAPCDGDVCGRHLAGGASFSISPSSPPNPNDVLLVGQNVGGKYTGGPGTVTLELSLIADTDPVVLNLVGARAEVNVSEGGLMNGKLGGAVTEAELNSNVLPAIASLVGDTVARDCSGTHPDCCTAGSTGQTLIDLFDTNEDCQVSLDEIRNSNLISSLLAPDVDLFDDTGKFNPRTNGIKDSLSLGIGFSGVPATYTLPSGI
jgi:hypothetical protein